MAPAGTWAAIKGGKRAADTRARAHIVARAATLLSGNIPTRSTTRNDFGNPRPDAKYRIGDVVQGGMVVHVDWGWISTGEDGWRYRLQKPGGGYTHPIPERDITPRPTTQNATDMNSGA